MKKLLLYVYSMFIGVLFGMQIEARNVHRIPLMPKAPVLATHVDTSENIDEAYDKAQDALDEDEIGIDVGEQSDQAPEIYEEDISTEQEPITPAYAEFNVEEKRKQVIKLVEEGKAWLEKNPEDKAMSDFSQGKRFVRGEIYLFVIDASKSKQGVVLAHGQDSSLIWQDLYNYQDNFGIYFIRDLIDVAQKGGGWLTYQWRNATKVTYVKQVKKNDKTYIIGAGYYPHSKEDAVVSLVKSAVSLFNRLISAGHPNDEAFSNFSYPLGRFVRGDLYLYALDFKGVHFAHGELPGLIGTNGMEYRDAAGKFVNKEIISKLRDKEFGTGIWVEYISRNAEKKAYAEKVQDKEGNLYFIAAGYYPTANREQVVNLVKKGYQYMKANGKTQAAKAFSEKRNMNFRFGDLNLFVYDMKGLCIANGRDPEFVGENQINLKDENGVYFVKEMIKKAEAGGGWIDFKMRNSFESAYVEKIDLGIDQYVIGSAFFPSTKFETMTLIAKSGADYLDDHDASEAFRDFIQKDGAFIRGDLEIFVFDSAGICLVYGSDYDLIWRNLLNINDDDGKPFVKVIINSAKRGQGVVSYKLNGVMKTAYIIPVKKEGKDYIVGSSFYQ